MILLDLLVGLVNLINFDWLLVGLLTFGFGFGF